MDDAETLEAIADLMLSGASPTASVLSDRLEIPADALEDRLGRLTTSEQIDEAGFGWWGLEVDSGERWFRLRSGVLADRLPPDRYDAIEQRARDRAADLGCRLAESASAADLPRRFRSYVIVDTEHAGEADVSNGERLEMILFDLRIR